MEYKLNGSDIVVSLQDVHIDANVGESAKLDVQTAVNFIKSGQAEVNAVANARTAEFNANAAEKIAIVNAGAESASQSADSASDSANAAQGYASNAEDSATAAAASAESINFAKSTNTDLETDGEPSDDYVPTQKAVKTYVDDGLSHKVDGADLATVAFTGEYEDVVGTPNLATVATSGSYNDLTNKPTLGTMAAESASNYTKTANLASVALSGSYNDLTNKPTIPTVNNATLTIQKNGSTVKTFTANASANVTANITVPTKVSDLNNDSGFITSSALNGYATETWVGNQGYALSSSLATVATSGSYDDLLNKPTIPTVNNATLTIQKNGTAINTFTANASSDVTVNVTVPTQPSDIGAATSAQGALADTALQPNDNISELVNDAGYTTNIGTVTSVNNTSPDSAGNVTLSIPAAQVNSDWNADSGVAQILNKPTIPTDTGDLTNGAGFITSSSLENYVTTDTSQDITGEKTFVGQKRIKFKALDSNTKLGFTAFDSQNREIGYLEGQGNGNSTHKFRLGVYDTNSSLYDNSLGFEYYKVKGSDNATHRYNLLCPSLYDSTTTQDFYIPIDISNGDIKVRAGADGVINISTLLPSVPTNISAFTNDAGYITSADLPTVNDATITITQGGTTKGSFTLNQSSGATIALDAGGGSSYTAGTGIDITSGTISVTAPTIINSATGNNALTILGTPCTAEYGINIGVNSVTYLRSVVIGGDNTITPAQNSDGSDVIIGFRAKQTGGSGYGVAIGRASQISGGQFGIALGYGAVVSNNYSIQIGNGTNNEANSLYVGTSSSNNYKLLGNDGIIPAARLPIATSVSSASTNDEAVGAKLFYDTCGDIETLINAL